MILDKKIIKNVSLASLLLAAAACTPAKKTEYNLTGTIKGIDSGMVKLVQSNKADRSSTTLDSVALTDGSFILSGKLENPEMIQITVTPGNWRFNLFMENSDITIEADTTGAEYWDFTGYGGEKGAKLTEVTIQGSENHNLYLSFEDSPQNQAFKAAYADLNKRFTTVTEEEQSRLREEAESLRQLSQAWELETIDSLVDSHPSSVVGAYLFSNYYQFNENIPLEKMEAILGKFQGEALSSQYYTLLDADRKQRITLQPGNLAPDFTALRPDSTEFSLSSTRGSYVLIDFWASWCMPCRKSIPHWKELYKDYKNRGLEIVGVTNDSRWSDWKKALNEEKMPWIQVADDFPEKNRPARIATMYMTPFLPSYTLIDPEGKIVLHNASKDDITKTIERRLN